MSRTPPYDYTPEIDRPYELPDNTNVAVWVILNVEHFQIDEPYREGDPIPNSKDQGRRDYGVRAGYWRLLQIFDKLDIPATLALNAEVCEAQPAVVKAAMDRGWAIMGHGLSNSHQLIEMDRATQRQTIVETRERIESFTGEAPTGWLSPGLQSDFDTIELLSENGFEYLCDWCVGDQPFSLKHDLFGIPYSLDLNDKGLFGRQGLTGPQYRDSLLDAFRTLRAEGGDTGAGRILPIPLHPYITGQSFRAPYLAEALEEIAADETAWLTTGDELATHFIQNYR